MFTGIVEEIGHILSVQHGSRSERLAIQARKVLSGTRIGDSIAVNGICLTVTAIGSDWFTADVMPETLRRTNLCKLQPQSLVNLERALCLGDRLGGHLVSGHVDGTGRLAGQRREGNAMILRILTEASLLRYIINKGSITLDGVSLTVVRVDDDGFEVSLITHTSGETTLGRCQPGGLVNLECDVIGKYVDKLLYQGCTQVSGIPMSGLEHPGEKPQSRVDLAFLRDNGF